MSERGVDAIVVGSGPNGLAAAIALARAGKSVRVLEAEETAGGGMRSLPLTLPGFVHDLCSTIHPLGVGSPFFKTLPLAEHGLEWVEPPVQLAHPFDDGTAAVLVRSIDETAAGFGEDAGAYRSLFAPFVEHTDELLKEFMGPLRLPRHPLIGARFGLQAIRSATGLAKARFSGREARALFVGIAAHAMLPLTHWPSASFGLVLGMAGHAYGWPLAQGGSQRIADAMISYLRSLGGEVQTGVRVASLSEVPPSQAVLFDLTPRQIIQIAGDSLPDRYLRQLDRYRYGPGAFKIDWALDGPIPWTAEACKRAGTVHLGGAMEELEVSEATVARGEVSDRPFVLLAQQTLFDPTRAPAGKHTAWAYSHVPNGSTVDMTERIEAQIERFAPGFRERVLQRAVHGPAGLEDHDANYIGGDINGGIQDLRQLFTRPTISLTPYATPNKRLFICSSSTPPGGGVHGMCGYYGARTALKRLW
jgi:phytoene dehydrogenase-like protein